MFTSVVSMRLATAFTVCNGLVNLGLAGIFYYYAYVSLIEGSSAVGSLTIVGLVFAVISFGAFRMLGDLSERTRTLLGAALMVVAVIELGFSFLFFSFAFRGESMSLLEVGVPLLVASISSFSSVVQEYRDRRRLRAATSKRRH